jgi:hypothetical protein
MFGTAEVDWQLWVQLGSRPIPRKYVITSKTFARPVQYTFVVKEWQTDTPARPGAFTFSPPADATKVGTSDLKELNQLPSGVAGRSR